MMVRVSGGEISGVVEFSAMPLKGRSGGFTLPSRIEIN
jgi:hypothetical protein